MRTDYFGWRDAQDGDPQRLADHFETRFPTVVAAACGPDAAYVRWFDQMLRLTAPVGLPYAFADSELRDDVLSVSNAGSLKSVPLPPDSGTVDGASTENWLGLGHPAEILWHRQHDVAPYPSHVAVISRMIPGTAFAPGGAGLWKPSPEDRLPRWPDGGVMILGHNFDSVTGYERSLEARQERLNGSTWRNMLGLLRDAGVREDACYFTNVFIGLKDSESALGEFPGAGDPDFVNRCLSFLATQLSVLRPSALLTLGAYVPSLLARLSPTLAPWRNARSLAALDQAEISLVHDVRFLHDPALRVVIAALTHPSFSHINQGTRSVGHETGRAAELALVKAVAVALPAPYRIRPGDSG
jgi:uracil-DNA glycosylase